MFIALGIILALVVFSVIVFFHELGHFATAKWSGVKVEEFGIGIPPRLGRLFRDRSGTAYTLNWLPIGGFVKMKGEDASEFGAQDPDSLAAKPVWKQASVMLAGVFMNFMLAWVILSVLFFIGIEPLAINTKFETTTETRLIPSLDQAVKIRLLKVHGLSLSPLPASIAGKAGIQNNDILLAINQVPVTAPTDMIASVRETKTPLTFTIERAGKQQSIMVRPENGKIGSYVGYNVIETDRNFRYKYGFFEAIRVGWEETYLQSKMTFELFVNLVEKIFIPKAPEDRQEAVKSLGGPIAVGDLFVNLISSHAGASVVFIIAALISINLGVFNLLPFPALDGGRFFLLVINSLVALVFGKRIVSARIEQWIHVSGFTLLIGVSIFVAYHDIVKLVVK